MDAYQKSFESCDQRISLLLQVTAWASSWKTCLSCLIAESGWLPPEYSHSVPPPDPPCESLAGEGRGGEGRGGEGRGERRERDGLL